MHHPTAIRTVSTPLAWAAQTVWVLPLRAITVPQALKVLHGGEGHMEMRVFSRAY